MNQHCRGCGAPLTKLKCPYCGRRITPGLDKVTPDPKDDPRKTAKPSTIQK